MAIQGLADGYRCGDFWACDSSGNLNVQLNKTKVIWQQLQYLKLLNTPWIAFKNLTQLAQNACQLCPRCRQEVLQARIKARTLDCSCGTHNRAFHS
jgi:hypothetical protein